MFDNFALFSSHFWQLETLRQHLNLTLEFFKFNQKPKTNEKSFAF